HEPGDIIRPVSDQTSRLLSVVSFDVFDDQAGPVAAEAIPTGWTSAFLATADHLYVFESDYSSMSDGTMTDILQFTWNTATGEIRATASGTVPGTTLNQFSADEYEGRLRVATNSSKFVDQTWTAENGVYVLENRGSELAIVGAVTGIAPGENIHSVRFAGDRGFVVTFRQVDPFYTLDLSDPTAPKVVGELKIPGYSSYLQVLDETHVVGIGRVDLGDWQWRVQVSVFDISDFADPRRIGLYTFDETVTGSPAEWEHLAFLWVPSLKLLAFPINASRYTPPTGELPLEAPIVLEDGLSIDGSLGGGDANDALIADGEDNGEDGGSAGDGSADDSGSMDDGLIDYSWLRMEKGEPMMVTTTSMPYSSWYGDFEDLSGLAFLRVDFDATDEAAGLVFEGIVRQSGTVRSVWIGDHLYAVASSGILAVDATAGHELVGSLDFGPEPGANNVPMVFPAVYWRGMEPLMASAGQSVEAAAETAYVDPVTSPSPWDDTTLADVLKAAMTAISEQLATSVDSIRLVTAECSGMDGATDERLYDMVFSVNGQRHHVHATVALDGSIAIEQVTSDYQFSTQSTTNEWHNEAEPCDIDGDGMVAPIDALNVINELNRKGSYRLGGDRPLRSIASRSIGRRSAFEPVRVRFDSSGDSLLAPIDALIVINRLNSQHPASGEGSNTSGGSGEGEAVTDLGSRFVVDSGAGASSDSRLSLGTGPWGSDAAATWRIDSTVRTATNSASMFGTAAAQSAFQNATVQAASVRDALLADWDASSDSSECLGALGDESGFASVDANAAVAGVDSVFLGM
ncbi:MAG: beta-propeller domain-containing protein, partial [Planctomycetota bacterium]